MSSRRASTAKRKQVNFNKINKNDCFLLICPGHFFILKYININPKTRKTFIIGVPTYIEKKIAMSQKRNIIERDFLTVNSFRGIHHIFHYFGISSRQRN